MADASYLIIVTDNGPGVDATVRERIFEPFFTTKGPPHNGLGLYLAAEAIKNINGHLTVRSPAEESRTEFVIELPRAV